MIEILDRELETIYEKELDQIDYLVTIMYFN